MSSPDTTLVIDNTPSKLSRGTRNSMLSLLTGFVLVTSTLGGKISEGSSNMPACTVSGVEWLNYYEKQIKVVHGENTMVDLNAMKTFPPTDIQRSPEAVIGHFYVIALNGRSRVLDGIGSTYGIMQATVPFSESSIIIAGMNTPAGECLLSTSTGVDQLKVTEEFKARLPIVQNGNNSMMVNSHSKIDLGKKTTDIKRHK
ncbi:MAG: hypothetical protein WCO33_01220 [bacterium]